MITNEHITLINTTFAQYNVNLVAKHYKVNNRIMYAEDKDCNNLLSVADTIEDQLTLQMILNNTFIEVDLPLTFDKETLLNKVKEVLESKANSLQRGLDAINVLLDEVEDAFMIVIK